MVLTTSLYTGFISQLLQYIRLQYYLYFYLLYFVLSHMAVPISIL